MSEPSKWASELAIEAVKSYHTTTIPLRDIIQNAIDAALAEKDKELETANLCIKGLEGNLAQLEKENDQLASDLEASENNDKETLQRLASLQEIVEHYLRCRSFGEPTNFSNEYKDWKEGKQ